MVALPVPHTCPTSIGDGRSRRIVFPEERNHPASQQFLTRVHSVREREVRMVEMALVHHAAPRPKQLQFQPDLLCAVVEQLIVHGQPLPVHCPAKLLDFPGTRSSLAHLQHELGIIQHEMRPGFRTAMLKMAARVCRPDRVEPYVRIGAWAQHSCNLDQRLRWIPNMLERVHSAHKIEPLVAVDELCSVCNIELEAVDRQMFTVSSQLF